MSLVHLEHNKPVATLTLNRPERHNSLVPELLDELLQGLAQFGADEQIRAMVLAANGRSFSTGGDIAAFYQHRENMNDLAAYANSIVGLLNKTILALLDLPIPVIAAVQGIVTGGSIGLVLACDLALLAPQASITPYYSVVGFSPDGGWTAMLPKVIGVRRAADCLLTNRTISAQEAFEWGLACRVVPAKQLMKEAYQIAEEIAGMKPGSIRTAKTLLAAQRDDLAFRLEEERLNFVAQVVRPDSIQGMASFLSKA
jgi:2-(1,2-epoxy-1,2-dihydrophenyl)acetyl-CoA isomerase